MFWNWEGSLVIAMIRTIHAQYKKIYEKAEEARAYFSHTVLDHSRGFKGDNVECSTCGTVILLVYILDILQDKTRDSRVKKINQGTIYEKASTHASRVSSILRLIP